ncbi:hypothetical protein IAU60_005434 [Kwoniella sp. DSM 27419]
MWMMTIVLSSVPYGLSTTFFYTLGNGGAMVAIWDWIIMSCIYVCVAVSLGEIASQYPVSGGVYYWSYMLSPTRLRPMVSWIVGWLSVVGNITVTLAVNFATAQLILSSVIREWLRRAALTAVFYPDYTPETYHTVLTAMATVLATLLTLSIKADAGRRSASYVFTATGMLPAMAEEAKRPELTIPRAIGTLGLIFLLSIMFTLGDLATILASPTGQPLPEIFLEATGTHGAAFGLFFLSRSPTSIPADPSPRHRSLMWPGLLPGGFPIFARDGGIPGRSFFGKTSKRLEMPLNGFLLHSVIQCALACIYFGSTAAFNAFLGVSVLSLGGACFVPILVSFLRGRRDIAGAKFYKGKFGYFCNWWVRRGRTR